MASHRSIAERRALVAEWLESDLTTAAFAEICGVSPSSLHRWRGQLDADRETAPQAGFVELVPAPGSAARETEAAAIEVRLAGAAIMIRPGIDGETLATVLAALRPAS